MNPAIRLLGRRLRLGVIGGGSTSMIGLAHRLAARVDDQYEIVAGSLSSDPRKAAAEASRLGIPRGYGSPADMFLAEKARADGIDVVSIMTPDDTHVRYAIAAVEAGLDVICEKPLSNDLQEALKLAAAVRRSANLICLTHNYSGFPMIREARAAIAAGEIGRVHLVQVTYLMGSLATRVEDDAGRMPDRLKWRLDPTRGGISHVLADLGSHGHHLATYVTGSQVQAVLADLGAAVEGRTAHDTAAMLIRMRNGARGVIFASKAASGAESGITIQVYGDEGGLSWEQANPGVLRVMRPGMPSELRSPSAGMTLHPLTKHSLRNIGGSSSFMEAFGNLYYDFGCLVAARLAGVAPDPLSEHVPGLADGIAGLYFMGACVASFTTSTWADCPA